LNIQTTTYTWPAIATNSANNGQFVVEFTDPAPPPGNLYYRLKLLP
jgi:hypothetical protein